MWPSGASCSRDMSAHCFAERWIVFAAQIYDRLQTLGQFYAPVAGNQEGSYLTMWSSGGLQFEVIFFFSAISQMLVDQSYWQSAIAAKPTAAVKVPCAMYILHPSCLPGQECAVSLSNHLLTPSPHALVAIQARCVLTTRSVRRSAAYRHC